MIKKDPLVQLQASKSSFENLFRHILDEIKGFKYQTTITVLLSKIKTDGNTEYSVINSAKFNLDQSFQEILYRIDNWINQGSVWIIESVEGFYLNISAYNPLIRSTYINLPSELQHPMKGLINIQNNDNKCFLCCHVRHLNLVDKNTQRITKKDKLNYEGNNFPISKKDYCKIEVQNKICINVFCFENKVVYCLFIRSKI